MGCSESMGPQPLSAAHASILTWRMILSANRVPLRRIMR
jgi:hypothetical protein